MSVSDSQRDLISVQVQSSSRDQDADEDALDVDVGQDEDVDVTQDEDDDVGQDEDDVVAQVSGSPGGGLGGALSKMGADGNRKLWGGLICRSVTTHAG